MVEFDNIGPEKILEVYNSKVEEIIMPGDSENTNPLGQIRNCEKQPKTAESDTVEMRKLQKIDTAKTGSAATKSKINSAIKAKTPVQMNKVKTSTSDSSVVAVMNNPIEKNDPEENPSAFQKEAGASEKALTEVTEELEMPSLKHSACLLIKTD